MQHQRTRPATIVACLERGDAETRPARAVRFQHLMNLEGPEGHTAFVGGIESLQAYNEARLCYLNGLDMATVVMAQVALEHMLGGWVSALGRIDLPRASFQTLLAEAQDQGLLSQREFAFFERLRIHRNPYAHPRTPLSEGTIGRRVVESNQSFDYLLYRDARRAIRLLYRFFRRFLRSER